MGYIQVRESCEIYLLSSFGIFSCGLFVVSFFVCFVAVVLNINLLNALAVHIQIDFNPIALLAFPTLRLFSCYSFGNIFNVF